MDKGPETRAEVLCDRWPLRKALVWLLEMCR